MKVKLDENMPADLVDLLRASGHDVDSVRDEGLSGSDDRTILKAATSEDRVVVTFDVGFGNIREYPPGSHSGIVVFRLHDQRWEIMEGPARRLVESNLLARLDGRLAVVDESRIRLGKAE
jgi:predicted nuclease of predicted toxin-antitoxin system